MTTIHLRRAVCLVLTALGATALLPASAFADNTTPFTDVATSGKFQHIYLGNELSCQVAYLGDDDYSFFPDDAAPGDCGTFIATPGTSASAPRSLYGPDFESHANTATDLGPVNITAPFTPVSQSAITGTGSSSDPYSVTTAVKVPDHTITVTEVSSYVTTSQTYRSDITVKNTGTTGATGTVFHGGDCYLQGNDSGYGTLEGQNPACTINANNNPSARLEQFVAVTPGNRYVESDFANVWAQLGGTGHDANGADVDGRMLSDSVEPDDGQDNGAAISWDYNLAAGASTTFSMYTVISPNGISGQPEFVPPTSVASNITSGSCANNGVTVVVTDNAGGRGAAQVDYSIDGGAQQTAMTAGQPGSAVIPIPDGTHTLSYAGEDLDGNVETPAHTVQVYASHVLPTVTIAPGAPTSYFQGQSATLGVTAAALIPLAVNPTPSVTLDTSKTGTITKSVVATDVCGNTAAQPFTYKVTNAATQLGLPSAKQCVSRRKFKIHIKKVPGVTFRSVTITVPKQKPVTRKGKSISSVVNLKGLPKGKFTVKIVATTTTGQKITGSRVYKTCSPKKRKAKL